MRGYTFAGIVLVIVYQVLLTEAQAPPRLNIPGALLVQGARPAPAHRRIHHPPQDGGPVPLRIRKPIPNALPISIPIREESEDADQRSSFLDDEVAKLSISALQATRAPENIPEPPRPVQFRPERPVPVLRQDLRESASPPPRPFIRQDLDDDEDEPNIPVIRQPPQPIRQAPPPVRQHNPPPQQTRQRVAANPRPQPAQYLDEDDGRRGSGRGRKPPVQILRKYRTDNEDGSITWGFENEDGTFKEENIGSDCIIRGKYGYVDPEGTRREYNYEAGNKCEPLEEEYPPEELPPQQIIASRPSPKKQYNVPIRA